MNRLLAGGAGLLLVAALGARATAAVITFNEKQFQTAVGQNFQFVFTNVPPSDGTDATFILHARGNYGTSPQETLNWNIEDVVDSGGQVGGFGSGGSGGTGGPFDSVIEHSFVTDYEFTRTYALLGPTFQAIAADGMITLSVNLKREVDSFTQSSFVAGTLTYNPAVIPEPSSLAIVGLGALGLVGVALRRRQAPFQES